MKQKTPMPMPEPPLALHSSRRPDRGMPPCPTPGHVRTQTRPVWDCHRTAAPERPPWHHPWPDRQSYGSPMEPLGVVISQELRSSRPTFAPFDLRAMQRRSSRPIQAKGASPDSKSRLPPAIDRRRASHDPSLGGGPNTRPARGG